MYTFFDFLCYSAYKVYRNVKESGPEFGGAFAVSGLQGFNIYSLHMGYLLAFNKDNDEVKVEVWLSIFGVLMVANYIRYLYIPKFSIEAIKLRWDAKSLDYQKSSSFFQGLYVLVSILLFFTLVFTLVFR